MLAYNLPIMEFMIVFYLLSFARRLRCFNVLAARRSSAVVYNWGRPRPRFSPISAGTVLLSYETLYQLLKSHQKKQVAPGDYS
jgi:hypothetical protein